MDILVYLAVAVGAYLIGSLSSAIIISNGVKKKDIRDYGSGNAGATNMLRTFGWLSGLLTFLFDAAKGTLCAWLGWLAAGDMGMHIAAVCVVLGHNWPFWNKFRGGKGVAVNCTWLILYLPITGALCCLAGGGAVLLSGYLPLGAVLIAALAVPVAWLQYGGESAFIMAVSASIMLTRHWAGLQRMRRGEEPQFFRKWHY